MADIELVIKIPEKWFDDMVREEFEDVDELCAVIQHSTQLPKGHGRLKDVDHYIKMAWEHPDYSLMDDEPTIIEAEEESEEWV